MQILDERDVAEVTQGPITLVKSALNLGRENVSGVRLTVRSTSSDPVSVRIVEEFPGHVSMSDVQAHPSYGPHRWTVSEKSHRMVFEDEILPEGTAKTIYGVRTPHDGALDPFLGQPELSVEVESTGANGTPDPTPVEEPAPAEAESAADPETADDVEAATTDPSSKSSSEGTPAASEEEVDDSMVDDDPSRNPFVYGEDREETPAGPGGPEGPSDSSSAAPNAAESGDPIEALIERIDRDELSNSQERALRDALDGGPAPSEQIQLEQLQSSVTELSAFAAEFQSFVDAVGRPAETIEALDRSIQELSARVDELATTDRSSQTAHEELRERVDRLEADVDGIRRDHGSSMDDLDERLAELEAVLSADEFDAIREVIEAERVWREQSNTSRAATPKSTSGTSAK